MDDLRNKTISGLKWTGIERIFAQVFVFVAGVLMLRVLTRTDYGMVAVLGIFTYFAAALQESGFSAALIAKKNPTDEDYNTVFYFNICVSLALYVLLFFAAPYISIFYNEPQLTALSRVVFLNFVLISFNTVQGIIIAKTLNYKLITKINIVSMVGSYIIALVLAYRGFGPWAVVAQPLTGAAMKVVLLWASNIWRPKLMFSIKSFKELFGYGSNLLIKTILDTFVTRITPSVIGKHYGFELNGNYSQGNKLYSTVNDLLAGTIHHVSFPVLSNVHEEDRLQKVYRKMTRFVAFLTFPFFMGMILVASPFVTGCLGKEWLNSIPVVQLLAVGGIFYSLHTISMNLIKVKNKPRYILYFEIIRTILALIIIGGVLYWNKNYLYIIAGFSALNALNYILHTVVVFRLTNYTLKEHLIDILPYFAVAFVSIAIGFLFKFIISNQLILIVVQIFVVASLYVGVMYFSGSKIVEEVLVLLKLKTIKE